MKKTNQTYLHTILQGMVMGIVEVIPGVSGSTLALIMGIYDKFINFLHQISDLIKVILKVLLGRSHLKDIFKTFHSIDYKFGGLLIAGMLLGIGGFSHIMSYLLEHHPIYTSAFFFGLILASVRVPFFQIKKITPEVWLTFIFSSVLFFFILGLNPAASVSSPSLFRIFIAGFFAICAMVLPGVSGSFVLLLFGMYDYIIEHVKNVTKLSATPQEILNLSVLALGIVLGFAIFVRVLKYGLKKYPSYLMAFLAGLMVASLRILWPFMEYSSVHGYHVKLSPLDVHPTEAFTIILIIFVTTSAVLFINEKTKSRKLSF